MRSPALLAVLVLPAAVAAQRPVRPDVSAPVSSVEYTVEFTRLTAQRRSLHVTASYTTAGREPLLLSLAAWTPGAYELSWFARNVSAFAATGDGKPLTWDKLDADTWRVRPNGAGRVSVSFDYRADSMDNAMAWSKADFAFFNGTNVFLYPEGRDAAFTATVRVKTEADWKVTTGMTAGREPRTYAAADFHELVDMPFFVGAFDVDSSNATGKWVRLATYPAGKMGGDERKAFWKDLDRMYQPMIAVFNEAPYETYTTLIVFDDNSEGGSALEHSNSHLGIYTPLMIGSPVLPSITAHEIFHLWNVKRMRPADMVPYRYDRAQPTTLLWVSEGITDYYADLALVRSGIIDSTQFLELTHGKMDEVDAAPPVALEDASLSTWIHPNDGTGYIYYPKGSLAGFLLDVMIRDASGNASSLDAVMRDLYTTTWKKGKGFTNEEWWAAVSRAAGGKSFVDVYAKYIDGREPFPWSQVLAQAGIRAVVDSIREPRIGVLTTQDSTGVRVTGTDAEGAAHAAGVREGDYLVSVGDVSVTEGFGERFRARYAKSEGQTIPLKIRREGQPMTLEMRVKIAVRTERRLTWDRSASPQAARVRHGILTGTRGP